MEVADATWGPRLLKRQCPASLLLLSVGCREWASSEAEHRDGKCQDLGVSREQPACCLAYLEHRPGELQERDVNLCVSPFKSTSYSGYGIEPCPRLTAVMVAGC